MKLRMTAVATVLAALGVAAQAQAQGHHDRGQQRGWGNNSHQHWNGDRGNWHQGGRDWSSQRYYGRHYQPQYHYGYPRGYGYRPYSYYRYPGYRYGYGGYGRYGSYGYYDDSDISLLISLPLRF